MSKLSHSYYGESLQHLDLSVETTELLANITYSTDKLEKVARIFESHQDLKGMLPQVQLLIKSTNEVKEKVLVQNGINTPWQELEAIKLNIEDVESQKILSDLKKKFKKKCTIL